MKAGQWLDNLEAKVEAQEAEIKRLRSIAFGAEEDAQTVRKATIEQCAKVADSYELHVIAPHIAAAIRALKDKP